MTIFKRVALGVRQSCWLAVRPLGWVCDPLLYVLLRTTGPYSSAGEDNLRLACNAVGPFLLPLLVVMIAGRWDGIIFSIEAFALSFGFSWMVLNVFNLLYILYHPLDRHAADIRFDEEYLMTWLLKIDAPLFEPGRPKGSFLYMLLSLPGAFAGAFAANYITAPNWSIAMCTHNTSLATPSILCGPTMCCEVVPVALGAHGTNFAFVGLLAGNWYTGMTIARALGAFVNQHSQ